MKEVNDSELNRKARDAVRAWIAEVPERSDLRLNRLRALRDGLEHFGVTTVAAMTDPMVAKLMDHLKIDLSGSAPTRNVLTPGFFSVLSVLVNRIHQDAGSGLMSREVITLATSVEQVLHSVERAGKSG